MGMAKWESFLEDHIEGFFNRRFSSHLEPVELGKALSRELVRRRKKAAEGHVVPNAYTLELGAEDYERLCCQRVLDELHAAVERQVIAEECFMDGELSLEMKKQRSGKGVLEVHSSYQDEAPEEEAADDAPSHTIVLERSNLGIHQPLNLPREYELASLTAVNGVDKDSYLAIGEKQVYIGRLDKNDFILMDPNASRMHAYVTYERHRHFLHDAESTNGTFVNGKPVLHACLSPGDEIQIGSTVLLYEVI
ncbi:MAG: FHA domain-containing protein [Selenomonas sp.]|uniref:FhaA domain-containing protein n=1 Tax=Selenomonas sp. TaxID=2053611 RepID=UPI0025D03BCE|nr:FhaA domain-containing protein [Selenomonas sp.]MCI6100688.1 FHA domain-containing protein [Selenomonas sp.]